MRNNLSFEKEQQWKRRTLAGAGVLAAALAFTAPAVAAGPYTQTNLVSDIPGLAAFTDSNLANPWGVSFSPISPFWVSDNRTGVATLYNGSGQPQPQQPQPLVVTIPPPNGGTPPAAPTGQVFNSTSDFSLVPNGPKALFIFATEDGTISGWNGGTSAVLKVDQSPAGSVYKGLAIGTSGTDNFLYATDFHNGAIDVFNKSFTPAVLSGKFTDPNLPSGYAPFNIQNLGGKLYVTYALQDADKHDDVAGAGHGFVDVFDTAGNFEKRLISQGVLNSPWGLAVAPGDFGPLSNDLLVGNFGDGTIHAFDPTTGALLGTVTDADGNPITIEGLWALVFGNGAAAGDKNALFFTAGIPGDGEIEDHGLLGSIRAVPIPPTLALFAVPLAGFFVFGRRR